MTANGTTFIGYDKDGDKVFKFPNGNLMSCIGETEEEAEQEYTVGGAGGMTPALFIAQWGPITKEAP